MDPRRRRPKPFGADRPGAKTGIVEDGALGDFLVSTVCVTAEKLDGGYAQYAVKIPRTATYYVWARLRYPSCTAESFALIPGGETPTTDASRCLGKSSVGVDRWHWDSRGGSSRMSLKFDAGNAAFRVYAREAGDSVYTPLGWRMARPTFNPRLNLICLTTDPAYVPTDADAQAALNVQPTHYSAEENRVKPLKLPAVSPEDWACAGKKPIPDWLRSPRFYTKDAWRAELVTRKPGDVAFLVRQIAACEGSAFRMAGYYFGEVYFQSKVAPTRPAWVRSIISARPSTRATGWA